MIPCKNKCNKKFTLKKNMYRHLKYCENSSNTSQESLPKCSQCGKTFSRQDVVDQHAINCKMKTAAIKRQAETDNEAVPFKKMKQCNLCEVNVTNYYAHIRSTLHKTNAFTPISDNEHVKIIECAYKSNIVTYRVCSREPILTPKDFMNDQRKQIIRLIQNKQVELGSAVKVSLELFAEYTKWENIENDEKEIKKIMSFKTKHKVITFWMNDDEVINEIYKSWLEEICRLTDEFKERGSGWSINSVSYIEINIDKYAPLKSRGESDNDVQEPSKKIKRCNLCKIDVNNYYAHVRSTLHKTNASTPSSNNKIETIEGAYELNIITYRVRSREPIRKPIDFMTEQMEQVILLIYNKQVELGSAIIVSLELLAEYIKWENIEGNEKEIQKTKSFKTKHKVITLSMDDDKVIEELYNCWLEEICKKADESKKHDNGWTIKSVSYLEIKIDLDDPFKRSSYIPLPKWVQEKCACINVKNNDDASFFWAIISALRPADINPDRINSYPPYQEVIKTDGISIPINIKDIKKFEDMNDISINIFDITGKTITGPLYFANKKRDKHINLLFIEDGDKGHFCWIKNISRLIGSQLSAHNGKTWICDRCLLSLNGEERLSEHNKRDCSNIMTILPDEKNKILKFKNYCNQLKAPVVVYADFEAILQPIHPHPAESPKSKKAKTTEDKKSYTIDYQLHKPYSFGYYIKCNYDDSLSKYVYYRGSDCADLFVKSLEKELTPFTNRILKEEPMSALTNEQSLEFNAAISCHICDEKLDRSGDKVRDHCHLTGVYRGAAHSNCNLRYKLQRFIPVVLHNLSKYDSHFIIRALRSHNVKVLATNKENYISITCTILYGPMRLRFIDSYRFLTESLDKLGANLETNQFVNMRKHFSERTDFLRKGVFPYDYITCFKKLDETSLPHLSSFYNKLNNTNISPEQYENAQAIWKEFNVKTLGEYSDIYLKVDVLLLADIFENFRDMCLKTYKLDPAHYYTGPGLSWDAMLRYTKVKMELLTDLSMLKFISNAIRGGLSQCCGRHMIANNKYMRDYDPSKPSNFIIYLDANNQYGWAMSQRLPLKKFRWLSDREIENFDVMKISDKAAKGYILEVDLDYPKELHDSHNDLCFCPEKGAPEISKSNNIKLLSTLNPKRNYVTHYINLKQAINNGLVLKKIHRVLTFHQSAWLKNYIDLNTNMRKEANTASEKDLYKLMNNAVFGKTIENVEKRIDVRFVNRWESEGNKLGARALISRLNFHSRTEIEKDLLIIQMNRTRIKYDKPIYVGFAVLEISKTLMYDFHYNYMRVLPKFVNNVSLLYTDTDSFIYNIKTDDFYAAIEPDLIKRFDTSNFPSHSKYKRTENEKKVGMFKDELGGEMIKEFIGIRSKCYYIKKDTDDKDSEIKKIKGVKKNVVKEEINRDHYFNCASGSVPEQYITMNTIRSKAHTLYSQTITKIGLKNCDDKRFIIPDEPYKTLAWGHYRIKEL